MSTRGRLLVATPALVDPNFAFAVVYMLEHNDEGAIGVILTRPSELPAAEMFDTWIDRVGEPAMVFRGGPVSLSSVIALGVADDTGSEGFNPISAGIGTIDLEADPDTIPGLRTVRLFAGYAGWSPGQLEGELLDDAWLVLDAQADDLLTDDPESLWWSVVGRQAGSERLLANYPTDPWVN